jgi:hypothetical protein
MPDRDAGLPVVPPGTVVDPVAQPVEQLRLRRVRDVERLQAEPARDEHDVARRRAGRLVRARVAVVPAGIVHTTVLRFVRSEIYSALGNDLEDSPP